MKCLETLSRGYLFVAERNLSEGTQLFSENPLVGVNIGSEGSHGIFQPITRQEYQSLNVNRELDLSHRRCAYLLTIRFMNKLRESPSYEKYLSRYNDRQMTENYRQEIEMIIPAISQFYQGEAQTIQIRRSIDFVLRNAFTITTFELHPIGLGLYGKASTFNHSCEPNVHHHFNQVTGEVTFRTIRPVCVGEELCIAYIDVGQPTFYRRKELREKYQFHCMCAKCCRADPFDHWQCIQSKVRCFPTPSSPLL
jgi:hypothetical protein